MSDLQEMVRTRTISWQNPLPQAQSGLLLSGLDYLKGMLEGAIPPPPISALMDMKIVEVSEGRVVFSAQPAEYHYNPLGTVHGCLVATLLDSALGSAIHSTLPAGTGYATLEIKINFLRPMTRETGIVYCTGSIIRVGNRIATAEGRVTDADGKLYAHATTTCIILRPEVPDSASRSFSCTDSKKKETTTMTVSEAFEAMPNRFNPSAAAGITKTLQWNITGEESGVWAFQIANGAGQLIPGGVEKPDVTFTTSGKDWLAIAQGKQDAMKSFMTGRLKVTGDMMLAMKVPQFFPLQQS